MRIIDGQTSCALLLLFNSGKQNLPHRTAQEDRSLCTQTETRGSPPDVSGEMADQFLHPADLAPVEYPHLCLDLADGVENVQDTHHGAPVLPALCLIPTRGMSRG